MKDITRGEFELKKIKVSKDEVECVFNSKRKPGTKGEPWAYTAKSTTTPHPEFIQARDAFKEILMRSLGKYDIFEESMKYLKGDQANKVRDVFLDKVSETEVTGVSISGQDQMTGIIISGKERNKMGGNSAINSPRIVFSSDKLGSEKLAEQLWETISDEAWEYVLKGKKAQMDLFDEQPKKKRGRPRKTETV